MGALLASALGVSGCQESLEEEVAGNIAQGEEVAFATALSGASLTRTAKEDYESEMASYQAVNAAYAFTVEMYQQVDNEDVLLSSSLYEPVATVTTDTAGNVTSVTYDELGTLQVQADATPLYWPSTTTAYAFKAVAGSETLAADQSTEAAWLLQDRLEGYGYAPQWSGTDDEGQAVDNLSALNYHTAKEWKVLNQSYQLLSNSADYKKIPLYLQHKRSLITIILKAGEGVSRKALSYNVAENDLSATIYSYATDSSNAVSATAITPLASEQLIDYEADKNGDAATDVSTTRYDAIVEPYDYTANATSDPITKVSVSGQHYSFYAGNDALYDDSSDPNNASYQLEAGKHLTITITLSRDSRKVLMSAYIEDWTEEVTTTICDDYGNAGEPIKIKNREELVAFLEDTDKNKAGNIALVTNNIDLEDWSATNYDLNCTLSLGGCTLLSNARFLHSLGSAASLQNGTVQIDSIVDAAVATTNEGEIIDVDVTTQGATAYATVAGMVVTNMGTISKCSSALQVEGNASAEYVGGIAATSLSTDSKAAIIDGCTVSNRVDGGSYGGGIVGQADGYVTNNTFEYGITLLQNLTTHKNIVSAISSAHAFTADNNAWPTLDANDGVVNATDTNACYHGIIDNVSELAASTNTTYNVAGNRYRLAQDLTVQSLMGNVAYELDGNGKQLVADTMIFQSVTGQIHDLTVYVQQNLTTTADTQTATDAIAPLAFEVYGTSAALTNIQVKTADGVVITASNPAGVVVWAWGGATISNCEVRVNLYANVQASITQGRKFAGGIVSTVSNATVTQCVFHSGSSITGTQSSIIYAGGLVGGMESKDGSGETPELTVTDCTSFVTFEADSLAWKMGAIVGNTTLGGSTNVTSSNCQGNWWPSECAGVGYCIGSVEAAIGKRNSVTPSETDF